MRYVMIIQFLFLCLNIKCKQPVLLFVEQERTLSRWYKKETEAENATQHASKSEN